MSECVCCGSRVLSFSVWVVPEGGGGKRKRDGVTNNTQGGGSCSGMVGRAAVPSWCVSKEEIESNYR